MLLQDDIDLDFKQSKAPNYCKFIGSKVTVWEVKASIQILQNQ